MTRCNTIAELCRTSRKAAGLTQQQAAARAGMGTRTYTRLESGRMVPGPDMIAYAARALGILPERLENLGHDKAADILRAISARPEAHRSISARTETHGTFLTPEEHRAVEMAGELYTHIADKVVGHGPTREIDLAELRELVHGIQDKILGRQISSRLYPGIYRMLGETIPTSAARALTELSEEHGLYDIPPLVCITHMSYEPCRKQGEHAVSADPADVERVREHHHRGSDDKRQADLLRADATAVLDDDLGNEAGDENSESIQADGEQ